MFSLHLSTFKREERRYTSRTCLPVTWKELKSTCNFIRGHRVATVKQSIAKSEEMQAEVCPPGHRVHFETTWDGYEERHQRSFDLL